MQYYYLISSTESDNDLNSFVREIATITSNNQGAAGQGISKSPDEERLDEILSVIHLRKDFDSFPQAACAGFLTLERCCRNFHNVRHF